MGLFDKALRRIARKQTRQDYGLINDRDVSRMAARDAALGDNSHLKNAFGVKASEIPESAPDAEEAVRRNRRKMLAGMRKRSGRMSTILTGGETGMGLG